MRSKKCLSLLSNSGTYLNHTGIQQKNGKVLVNLALPMLMPDEDARPGIKLEFIRRQKGISRKELADKLEIAPGALFNLENGFNPIHFDDALKLGNALDVEPDIFIDESARFCASGYGEKIRIIRRACDATQEEFSKMIGVTRSTLSCWEAEIGEYHPSSVFYYKLKEIVRN